jgi:hypothetical protein
MSQAITENSVFENGYVKVTLQDTTVMGLKATMPHAFSYGLISCPEDDMVAEISLNSEMQQIVLGCIPHITKNMDIAKGESAIYSRTWRYFMRNNGIQLQQIETNKTAHAMMGEDTNKLIANLQEQIIQLTKWLQGLQNIFNLHVHSGVTTGVGSSAVPVTVYPTPVPDDATIIQDKTYTDANKNLATDDYTPREVHDGTIDTK